VVADVVDGFRELRRRRRAAEVIVLGGVQCVVRGALTVLAVVVAVDVTGLGRPGVGVLWAAFGFGGLVAALASISAAGSARLGTLFGAGIALWGVPLVVVGLLTGSYAAVAAFLVVGAANALVDVTGFTLLQRLVPDQTLARVLAVTEAVFSLAVALGSLAVPLLVSGLGDTGALVATGAVLPVAVAARWAALRAIDADIGMRKDRIVLLRRVRMLSLLPVAAIEGLALRLLRSGGRAHPRGGGPAARSRRRVRRDRAPAVGAADGDRAGPGGHRARRPRRGPVRLGGHGLLRHLHDRRAGRHRLPHRGPAPEGDPAAGRPRRRPGTLLGRLAAGAGRVAAWPPLLPSSW
jgi:hypothetical protein